MPRLGVAYPHWAIIADYGPEMGWSLMGVFNFVRKALATGQDMRTALFETRRQARDANKVLDWPKRRRVIRVDVWVTPTARKNRAAIRPKRPGRAR